MRTTPHKALAALAIGSMTLAAVVAACDDRQLYVYTAAPYDEDAACIGPYESLEVVPGEGASARCLPRCMTFDGKLFVSTICPPLPIGAELVPPEDQSCAAALRAFRADAGCADGAATPQQDGASNPPPIPPADAADPAPKDASPEADAPRDAGPG